MTRPADHKEQNHDKEQGNILWVVLIGVIMLGLLTVMLTRSSGTSNETADFEKIRIQASQMLRYASGVEQAVQQMIIRGISESDLCFDTSEWGTSIYNHADCATNANQVFHVEGGGLRWTDIPSLLKVDETYVLTGSFNVEDVGTTADELLLQGKVTKDACMEVNRLTGIANAASDAPSDATANAPAAYVGSFTAALGDSTIGDQSAGFAREKTGCRKNTTDSTYRFYHTLITR